MRKRARTPTTMPAIAPPDNLADGAGSGEDIIRSVGKAVLEEVAELEPEATTDALEADAASASKREMMAESDVCHRMTIGRAETISAVVVIVSNE
jgi:hypothetical protein